MGGSLENFIRARNVQSRSKSRFFLIFGPSGEFTKSDFSGSAPIRRVQEESKNQYQGSTQQSKSDPLQGVRRESVAVMTSEPPGSVAELKVSDTRPT